MKDQTETLVVVDDEEDIPLLFKLHFQDEIKSGQLALVFASSGEAAWELLNQLPKDTNTLVLLDINMPGINGFDLLKRITAQKPELSVFMFSACADKKNRQMAADLGAKDFIAKPIDFNQLKQKIFVAA